MTVGTPPLETRDDKNSPAAINAQKIRELYDKGTKAIRPEQLQYEINTAFLNGDQWCYINWSRSSLQQLPRDPRRVRITIPKMRPDSRSIVAKVMQRDLVFTVDPDAPDDETIKGAHTAQGVITHIAR